METPYLMVTTSFRYPPGNSRSGMPLKVRKNKAPPPLPACPLTECMALLAGAWTPNVIWYLSAGPRRFMELRTDMPTISAKVLSTRLRELEQRGIVTRTVMPTSPPSVEYALTVFGQELMPAIRAIVEVGHKLKGRQAAAAPRSVGAGPDHVRISLPAPGP
jgi:DNA-binding HxlR family transcriptional regulator